MSTKIRKMAVALMTAGALAGGGLVLALPASAAGCGLVASTPTKSGSSVKSTGGRTNCSSALSTTVAVKGVRGGGLPDSVLAQSSRQASNVTWSVYYGSPTRGAEYRTQAWNSDGVKQSGTLVW